MIADPAPVPTLACDAAGGLGWALVAEQDVEVVRAMFAAWERGDIEGMLEWVAPEVDWHPSVWSGGMSYHGHAGVRDWAAQLAGPERAVSIRAREIRAGPAGVVVIGEAVELGGEGRGVGRSLGWLFEVENEKVTRGEGFSDPDRARRLAGLWD